jgi:hypothetical protein
MLKNCKMIKIENMKNKILLTISFLASVLILNSCLKDDVGENWTSSLKGKMYAEFPSNGPRTFVIQPVATDQVCKFLVNIATDVPPTSNITLTFVIDEDAMDAYNTSLHAADPNLTWSYQMYPGASLIDPTITIEAGTRNAYVHVKLPRADTLNLNNKYIVPVSIATASGGVVISGNKHTVLYRLPVANKWEGTYKGSGYILRDAPFDPVLSGNRKFNVKLATLGPNSVQWTTSHIWGDGIGGVGGIGNWELTIDESTTPNPVTIVDPDNATVGNLPSYNSRYDPVTKTFYIYAVWAAGIRQELDTLVYSGPY